MIFLNENTMILIFLPKPLVLFCIAFKVIPKLLGMLGKPPFLPDLSGPLPFPG